MEFPEKTIFENATQQARGGGDLSSEEMQHLVGLLLDGALTAHPESAESVKQWLIALAEKPESTSELIGAARALRSHMTPIRRNPVTDSAIPPTLRTSSLLLDTCGTGGSRSGTFNISTATAIVVAAAGVPVAKHGNRKATSHSGSADVLSELGVQIESDRETVERVLAELNLCFCFAPKLHPAMRHVGEIRRSISTPTMFNFLGPLCNPAGATHQLLGTGRADKQPVIAEALSQLGIERAFVVRGEDGQDEVTLEGTTFVLEVLPGRTPNPVQWTPEMFGLPSASISQMQAKTPKESAEIIRSVFSGKMGPCRDIVLANAAAALLLVGFCDDLPTGVAKAAEAIDTGKAEIKLNQLAFLSQSS